MPTNSGRINEKHMSTVTVKIQGITPFMQSRAHCIPKEGKESDHDHECRTWKQRAHIRDGTVIHPVQGVKNALISGAKYAGIKTKGNETLTKHIRSGVVVNSMTPLASEEDIVKTEIFCPSNGQSGSGKRVWKFFPTLTDWGCVIELTILDNTVTYDRLYDVFEQTGIYIGLGSYRPENGGECGRFRIIEMSEF